MTQPREIRFVLNGAPASARVAPHETLVELLTDHLALFGARTSCGQGLCGCCTVYLDDVPVSACLYLADWAEGRSITTIEGLGGAGTLDPVQDAFMEAGALQCGFCTPGMIMMVRKLLERHPEPSDDDIDHYLSGNLCRCSAYVEIRLAVHLAAEKLRNLR